MKDKMQFTDALEKVKASLGKRDWRYCGTNKMLKRHYYFEHDRIDGSRDIRAYDKADIIRLAAIA